MNIPIGEWFDASDKRFLMKPLPPGALFEAETDYHAVTGKSITSRCPACQGWSRLKITRWRRIR